MDNRHPAYTPDGFDQVTHAYRGWVVIPRDVEIGVFCKTVMPDRSGTKTINASDRKAMRSVRDGEHFGRAIIAVTPGFDNWADLGTVIATAPCPVVMVSYKHTFTAGKTILPLGTVDVCVADPNRLPVSLFDSPLERLAKMFWNDAGNRKADTIALLIGAVAFSVGVMAALYSTVGLFMAANGDFDWLLPSVTFWVAISVYLKRVGASGDATSYARRTCPTEL